MGSNPHPVRKLGAMSDYHRQVDIHYVPILTQSENWALFPIKKSCTGARVPILTQSENWAL